MTSVSSPASLAATCSALSAGGSLVGDGALFHVRRVPPPVGAGAREVLLREGVRVEHRLTEAALHAALR